MPTCTQEKLASQKFSVKPSLGVIKPRSFAIIAVQFRSTLSQQDKINLLFPPTPSSKDSMGLISLSSPLPAASASCSATSDSALLTDDTQRTYSAVLRCRLNNSKNESDAAELTLRASSHAPRLSLVNKGKVYFKPTSAGMRSQRCVRLCNESPVATAFQWVIPSAYQSGDRGGCVLRVTPERGLLRGKESIEVVWEFAPKLVKKYKVAVPCYFFAPSPLGDDGAAERKANVPIERHRNLSECNTVVASVRAECITGT